jgi:hypothetical protein
MVALRNAALLFLLLLYQCSSKLILVAGSNTVQSKSPSVAIAESLNVSIQIESQAWSGGASVCEKITPVKITIQNKSGYLLRIRYNEFLLKSENSKIYSAYPPFEINGTMDDPEITLPYPFPIRSNVISNKFAVASYCSRMYPSMPEYRDIRGLDSLYYCKHYAAWARILLPTEKMLQEVLPDGVLNDGGNVSGFLYFEKLANHKQRVSFYFELVDAVSGRQFGVLQIPLALIKQSRSE